MSGMLDYVAEAIRLLRDQADAVHELHNAPGETTFEGEPEAEAAYAELERVANGLETEIAARLRGDGEQVQPAPSEQVAASVAVPEGAIDALYTTGPGVTLIFRSGETAARYITKVTEAMQLQQNAAAPVAPEREVR